MAADGFEKEACPKGNGKPTVKVCGWASTPPILGSGFVGNQTEAAVTGSNFGSVFCFDLNRKYAKVVFAVPLVAG